MSGTSSACVLSSIEIVVVLLLGINGLLEFLRESFESLRDKHGVREQILLCVKPKSKSPHTMHGVGE